MATRTVNEAVQVYRNLLKIQRRADRMAEEVSRRVEGMTDEEFRAYALMTTDIDKALQPFDDDTAETILVAAANGAGRDS